MVCHARPAVRRADLPNDDGTFFNYTASQNKDFELPCVGANPFRWVACVGCVPPLLLLLYLAFWAAMRSYVPTHHVCHLHCRALSCLLGAGV